VAELQAAGLNPEAISGIMPAMQVRSLQDLQQLLGDNTPAVQQLQRLFRLAEGYGFQDWLVFDASIVRGLAYYTGQHWNLAYCDFQSVVIWRTVLSVCGNLTYFSIESHRLEQAVSSHRLEGAVRQVPTD